MQKYAMDILAQVQRMAINKILELLHLYFDYFIFNPQFPTDGLTVPMRERKTGNADQ